MSLVVMAINKVYERLDETLGSEGDERLTRRVLSYADYFVKTFSTMTEPELLPWFPRWTFKRPVFLGAGLSFLSELCTMLYTIHVHKLIKHQANTSIAFISSYVNEVPHLIQVLCNETIEQI